MNNHENFIKAIHDLILVKVTFNTKEKEVITRICVPLDFCSSRKIDTIDQGDEFHFYYIDSLDGPHSMVLSPSDVVTIKLTSESFDLADYIRWSAPYGWCTPRDWGKFS